jgi:hypothetical protein
VVRSRRAVVDRRAVVHRLRGRVAVHGVDRGARLVVARVLLAAVLLRVLGLLRVLRVATTGLPAAGQAREAGQAGQPTGQAGQPTAAGQAGQVRQVAGQARQARERQGGRRRGGERGTCRDAGPRECHGSDDTNAPDDSGNHG